MAKKCQRSVLKSGRKLLQRSVLKMLLLINIPVSTTNLQVGQKKQTIYRSFFFFNTHCYQMLQVWKENTKLVFFCVLPLCFLCDNNNSRMSRKIYLISCFGDENLKKKKVEKIVMHSSNILRPPSPPPRQDCSVVL